MVPPELVEPGALVLAPDALDGLHGERTRDKCEIREKKAQGGDEDVRRTTCMYAL